ncbi:MAG: hypothetical protein HYY34_02170 [Chloroflexi bacterium]|nr:hypothetical protein [Chloroflexota bacterium]
MRQTAIEFEVDGEKVDGVMAGPVEQTRRMPAAVVCHPHPVFGGTMNSPVVIAVCYELAQMGVATLRFNFRRPKDGSPAVGEGAVRDVATAFWVIRQWDHVDPERCAITGYSFGAAAVLKAWAHLDNAKAVSLISPPLNALRESRLGDDHRARQIVVGDDDKLVRAGEMTGIVEAMRQPPALVRIAGGDHFLAGHEKEVGQTVAKFLANSLVR